MKLTNNTNNKIEVQIKGTIYSLEANSSKVFSKEVAIYWKTKIHPFLVLEEITEAQVIKPVDVVTEIIKVIEPEQVIKEEVKVKKIIKIKKIK